MGRIIKNKIMNPLVYTPRVYENPTPMRSPLAPIPKRKRKRCACPKPKKPDSKKTFCRTMAYVLCVMIVMIAIRLSMIRPTTRNSR